jgi:hypothetical protein
MSLSVSQATRRNHAHHSRKVKRGTRPEVAFANKPARRPFQNDATSFEAWRPACWTWKSKLRLPSMSQTRSSYDEATKGLNGFVRLNGPVGGVLVTEKQRRWGIAGLFLLALMVALLILLAPWDAPQPSLPQHDTAQTNGPTPLPSEPQPIPPEERDPPAEEPQPPPPLDEETPAEEPAPVRTMETVFFHLRFDLVVPTYNIPGLAGYKALPVSGVWPRRPDRNCVIATSRGIFERSSLLELDSPMREGDTLVYKGALNFFHRRPWEPPYEYEIFLTAFLAPLDESGKVIPGMVVIAPVHHVISDEQILENDGVVRIKAHHTQAQAEIQLPTWAAGQSCTLETIFPAFSDDVRRDHPEWLERDTWPRPAGVAPRWPEDRKALSTIRDLVNPSFEAMSDEIGRLRIHGIPGGMGLRVDMRAGDRQLILEPGMWRHVYRVTSYDYVPATAEWQFKYGQKYPFGLPDIELTASPELTAEERDSMEVWCVVTEQITNRLATIRFDDNHPLGLWEVSPLVRTMDRVREHAGRTVEFVAVGRGFEIARTSGVLEAGATVRVALERTDGYEVALRMADTSGLPVPIRYQIQAGPMSLSGHAVLTGGETLTLRGLPAPPGRVQVFIDDDRWSQAVARLLKERLGLAMPLNGSGWLGVYHPTDESELMHDLGSLSGVRTFELRPQIRAALLVPKNSADGANIRFYIDRGTVRIRPEDRALTKDYSIFSLEELREVLKTYDLLDAYVQELSDQ